MTKLDLHGRRHEEAKRLLETTLNSMWCTGEELEIITGNSPKMKEIVLVCKNARKRDHGNLAYGFLPKGSGNTVKLVNQGKESEAHLQKGG